MCNRRGKRERPEPPEHEAAPPPRGETGPSVTIPSPSLPTVCRATSLLMKRAHTLRNHKVFVPDTDEPKLGPMQYRKKPVCTVSWRQTPASAKVALEHCNRLNEDEYELVKGVDSVSFFFNGAWMHANLLAKLKGATRCPELVPKFYFAELYVGPDGVDRMPCVSCVN